MKNWQKILFAIIVVGGLLFNIYEGYQSDFKNMSSNIISFSLFSILALSKFTKHPL